MSVAVALAFTFVAAATQRMSGIGFALILAPVFALVLDPWTGVTLVIVGGALVTGIVFVQTRRDTDWSRVVPLVVFGVVGAILGYLVARVADDSATRILVGATVVLALSGALWASRRRPVGGGSEAAARGVALTGTLGLVSGVMTALGGLGGPAVTMLAAVQRWPHRTFVATTQFVGIGVSALVAVLRLVGGGSGHPAPELDWAFVAAFFACILLGLALGTALYRRVPPRIAWIMTIVVSYLGAAAAIVVGLTGLSGS